MSVGTKWYKCDLHLHTPASLCFKDRNVTPEEWVTAAIDKGLNCVAVTDHNTAAWIDEIKAAAKDTQLTVFPGVELTCGDAKVHLLILFDKDKGKQDVEDFIRDAGIEREKFGQQDAHSPKNADDVFKLALERKAICIPAHIDEFNGISEIANQPRISLLEQKELLGVQVVHELMTKSDKEYQKNVNQTHKTLNQYYGEDIEKKAAEKWKVSLERLKNWRQAVVQAQKNNKAIMTFSDNPHEEGDSKHGLWGIGTRYTWIKMDISPTLESLRQALLLHKFRIRNDFECPDNQKPYLRPEVIIRSIRIENTHISDILSPFDVKFSPQMTTVIGGRGSGKSTILQVLRGIFGKHKELEPLDIVFQDFQRFFRIPDARKKYGILKNTCSFEVELERGEDIYSLKYSMQSSSPVIELYRTNTLYGNVKVPNYQDFLHLLDFEIYSQKQIYEVATNLNSLREKIDASDEQLVNLKKNIEAKRDEYKQKSTEIRSLEHKIKDKGRLEAEIFDLDHKIKRYNENSIEEYINKIQTFDGDDNSIAKLVVILEERKKSFQVLADDLVVPSIGHLLNDSSPWQGTFNPIIKKLENQIAGIKSQVESIHSRYADVIVEFKNEVANSSWAIERQRVTEEFQRRQQQLIDSGIEGISNIEDFMARLRAKNKDLEVIKETELLITGQIVIKKQIKQEYIGLRQQLTKRREVFLTNLLKDRNVRAKVGKCKDMEDLEKQVRRYAGADSGFNNDITQLTELWSEGESEESNKVFNKHLTDLQDGSNRGGWDSRFVTKIKNLSGESFDDFDLLFPEDEIQIEYKNSAGLWKPISNASAGQKTAAILTLILSQGTKPLLLDQPEDDLDNRLIYDLVVDQLRISKESRQIIVVTHNANIPVNGDSEHIIVMDAESKYIKPLACGCIEEQKIKDSICEIMEGGTEAFDMRSRRYKNM